MHLKTKPWKHQTEAFEFAYEKRGAMLDMDMRTGKSRVAIELIAQRKHRLILVLCPKRVIDVWPAEFLKHSATPVVILPLSNGSVATRAKELKQRASLPTSPNLPVVAIVNYDAAWREPLATVIAKTPWDLVIADECVPVGTLISTPQGPRAIESLYEGDLVLGYDEQKGTIETTPVITTFEKVGIKDILYRVDGTILTGNHPVWTMNRGYVPAANLRPFDIVGHIGLQYPYKGDRNDYNLYPKMSMVRQGLFIRAEESEPILQPKLLSPVENVPTGVCCYIEYPSESRNSPREYDSASCETGCPGENICASPLQLKPSQQARNTSQGSDSSARERICAFEWWQRNTSPIAPTAFKSSTRLANRVCSNYRPGLSTEPLQVGYCGASPKDCGGGRWRRSSFSQSTRSRTSQRAILSIPRLDSPAIFQQGNTEGSGGSSSENPKSRKLYNLETGTGNYFANGLLVHNCHRVKQPSGKASWFLTRLGKLVPYRLALTGTPMPHSPLDIYAQYRFLDPTIFGTSFARFRNRYALMGGYGNYRVVGFQNQEEFRRKYFSIAYQVKIRDVFDMPPEEYPVFSTSLGAEATRVYTELRKQFVADVKDGSVTANNVLTRLLRFQQITSGFVGTDEKNIVDIDNAKESLLADVLEDFAPEEPIVIFCLFTRDIAVCKRIAEKQGRKALELSGTVDEVKEWQSAKAPVLVCQIRSGSLGLDFSRAYYAIYYSVGFFHGDYNQAQARLRNPKKTGTTIHIHLVVRHSVDEQVYESFRKGEDVIKAILAEAKKERQEKLVHA